MSTEYGAVGLKDGREIEVSCSGSGVSLVVHQDGGEVMRLRFEDKPGDLRQLIGLLQTAIAHRWGPGEIW